MKKARKAFLSILLVISMIFATVAPAMALTITITTDKKETEEEGPAFVALDLVLETDKDSYTVDEEIEYTITLTNNTKKHATDVRVINFLSAGLKTSDGKMTTAFDDLAPGESASKTVYVAHQTYDNYGNDGIGTALNVISIVFNVFKLVIGKLFASFLPYMCNLDVDMDGQLLGMLSMAFAYESTGEEADDSEEPEVPDADKDGLSDEEEEIFGTDPTNPDTDDDGFTDFEEIMKMGTDPLAVTNPDVDTDGDGLDDYEEVKEYNTDINSEDTDGDTLTDYDEVNVHNTNPLLRDTDDDGLSDDFEIANGFDPNNARTDGKTFDGDVEIEQTIGEESISDDLLDDENVVVPSLRGTVAGNLSDEVFIATSTDCTLEDNRSIVGEPICIDGDAEYVNELTLSFNLSAYEGNLNNLSICKLNEDGIIELVDSTLDGDTISCPAVVDATLFVMDIDSFLKALGVDLDEYKSSYYSLRVGAAEIAGDKVSGQADIVFAIDTTGSMSDEIRNVIYNVSDFTERLATEYNVKVNYALIDYRDLEEDGPGTTKVIKNGTSNWYTDVNTYKTALNKLYANGGGDTPECAVDALETARRLDFRKTANKFVILITDANYKVLNDYGITSMEAEAQLLRESGINTSIVCTSYDRSVYETVYTTTGGIYANIYGNFSEELLKLADLIGEETSDGEWVILKHGLRYVKLPALPTPDSTNDTDEDGLIDYVELGKKITYDLTTFIKAQLANNGVPFEVYDGKTSIDVYDSIADPTLYDTDGDGICDLYDSEPWNKKVDKYTQTHTASSFYALKNAVYEKLYFKRAGTALDGTGGVGDFCIPGLDENMVPQGLAYYESNNWLLISAYYKKESGKKKNVPSVIFALDFTTGKKVAEFEIYSEKGAYCGHAGGIAVTNNNLYITDSNSSISYVPLSQLKNSADKLYIKGTFSCADVLNNAETSYLSYQDGILWTGNFYEPKDYTTKAGKTNSAVVGYEITGANSVDEWNNLCAKKTSDYRLNIPNQILKIQGMSYKNNTLYLLSSYGRGNDSTLYIINTTIGSKKEVVLNDYQIIKGIPMLEGMIIHGSSIYTLAESAAWYYNGFDPLNTSKNPSDVVWRIDL